MIYWLNRRVERAFAAYLAQIVSGEMRVYRSGDLASRQFPCVVVRAHQVQRVPGELSAVNRMLVTCTVMHEFARIVDSTATVIEEFEEVEERNVSAVLEALFISDLATQLNAVGVDGLTINFAEIGDESNVTSEQEEDGTVSKTHIPLIVHAGAKEL